MTTSKNPGYIAFWEGGQLVTDSVGDVIVFPTHTAAKEQKSGDLGVQKVHRLVRWAKPRKKAGA